METSSHLSDLQPQLKPPQVARRASQLLEYIVRQSRDDRVALCHVSGFMAAALGAATSDDAATRQAALQTVFELMKDPSARGTVRDSMSYMYFCHVFIH